MTTLHVIGLPWTTTTDEFSSCAYTAKIKKFGDMMTGRSRRVVLYTGGEANEAQCDEHVPVFDEAEREIFFGKWSAEQITNGTVTWDVREKSWRLFNHRATKAIRDRIQDRDLILVTGGNCQRPITDALPYQACEWAVGYEGIFSPYCAFESQAWMHHVYGLNSWRMGRFYDAVIPNFFDPLDFHRGTGSRDYLLYLGRVIGKKGVHVAWQIAKAAGMPLVVAGPGGRLECVSEDEVRLHGDGFEPITGSSAMLAYVGSVTPPTRAILLSHAHALVVPTLYVEPFG